ncbi:DUF3558 domain-containing protein [Actinophytocola xinjiangensis]|nr:DUF3558 domain-containing protein [Actinophytocola xinjiangensis]
MRTLLVGVLAVTLVSAGCTSTISGTPYRSASTLEMYGAPPVLKPLEVSGFLGNPCKVLTQPQMAELTILEPGTPRTTGPIWENDPGCQWFREDIPSRSVVGMGFLPSNKHGLSDTYRGRDRFEYFIETTVDGYPAVFNETSAEAPPEGDCTVTVGVSDTLTFRASENGGPKGGVVCERTKEFASAILATLKAGA